MSRSGYTDWDEEGDANLYRANMDRAMAGKNGQRILRELLAALDLMPVKRLARYRFEEDGDTCIWGALAKHQGVAANKIKQWDDCANDGDDHFLAYSIAETFKIKPMIVREVLYENDAEWDYRPDETPEMCFDRMRHWVALQIKE